MGNPFVGGPERIGSAAFSSSQGAEHQNAPGGIVRVLSVQPWDVQPIPTAQNFFAQELANLVLPGPAGSTVTSSAAGGGAFKVPVQNIVSIQAVSLFCDTPTLTTSITYTVRANGSGIPGLINLKFPPQSATFLNFPLPGPFNVYSPGAYIDFIITRVVTDVAKQVNLTFLGWFCTPQDVKRWTGQPAGQVFSGP